MRRMAFVFARPAEAFRDLAEAPWAWVAPALLVSLFMSIAPQVVYTLHHERQQAALDAMIDRGLLTEETAQQARLRIAADAANRGAGAIAWQVTLGVVASLAFRFILPASILLAGLRFALSSPARFPAVLGAVSLASLPAALREIVRTPLQRAKGSLDVYFGPAAFVGHTHTTGAQALAMLDLFDIWILVLLVMGLAEVGHVPRARAATLVLPLWFVLMLVRLGLKASPLGAAF